MEGVEVVEWSLFSLVRAADLPFACELLSCATLGILLLDLAGEPGTLLFSSMSCVLQGKDAKAPLTQDAGASTAL